ncbi:MAG: GNAT family protein [Anaerolineaceae bacterium]
MMRLIDDDLVLRAAEPTDAKQLTEWWNDGRVMEHAGYPNGLGTTEWETLDLLRNTDPKTMVRLIIEIGGTLVGECSYRIEGNQAELGIKLCEPEYQNRGYGTRTLKLMIDHIFSRADIEKIVLDSNINNKRAQHVYKALGFKKVTTRFNAWQDQLGAWQSAVDYELRREDFNLT